MISLIVNADDLGINAERDRGIIDAFQNGIVTSTTMIANGVSFDTAKIQAKKAGIPIGVHLNLSEGISLSGPISGLTDQHNRFPGKIKMREYLLGCDIDVTGIYKEFSAQVEKIFAAGLSPGHLDGHQHCHIYPGIIDVVIELAHEYRIDAVRSVHPASPDDTKIPEELSEDIALFKKTGPKAAECFIANGLRTTDGLWGLPCLHSLDTTNLCSLLSHLPEGHWELMTHPGYPVPHGKHFESDQRQVELTALIAERTKAIIKQRDIRLTTFGELPCVS